MLGIVAGRDHDDRNEVRFAVPFQPVAELEAAMSGSDQVEQDQVGLPRGDGGQRSCPRVDLDGFEITSRTRLAKISLASRSSSTTKTVRGMGKTRMSLRKIRPSP